MTRDPNLRYTSKGTPVCSFSIATNRSWTPSDGGEKQQRTEFHRIVAWSKLAEICGQLLHKGDKVYVEGRLKTNKWQTEEGQDRRTTEVVINNMILLRSANNRGASTEKEAAEDDGDEAEEEMAELGDEEIEEVEDVSDDIPF
jgi:single-strand DNA-binding protein